MAKRPIDPVTAFEALVARVLRGPGAAPMKLRAAAAGTGTQNLAVADVEAVYAAGVSRDGLIRAVQICAAFTTIVRLADTFDFAVGPPDYFLAGARDLMKRGYILP